MAKKASEKTVADQPLVATCIHNEDGVCPCMVNYASALDLDLKDVPTIELCALYRPAEPVEGAEEIAPNEGESEPNAEETTAEAEKESNVNA